jgi:short-subunit dehydrogenase
VTTPLFQGSTALVTGASSGIGAAFAEQVAAAGARVVLAARDEHQLALVAERVRGAGGIADVIPVDLAADGGVAALLGALAARGLTVDHLINNAGIGLVGRADQAPVEGQLRVLDLDARVPTELALHLLPGMVARRRGGLLNVASIGAFQGLPWLSVYAASKAYLLTWSEALHVELRGTGVRCCALCPGPVATGWFDVAGLRTPPPRWFMQAADEVARAGLRGYIRNRSHVMSGPLARASAWLTRLAPRALAARVATDFARPRRPR